MCSRGWKVGKNGTSSSFYTSSDIIDYVNWRNQGQGGGMVLINLIISDKLG